MQFGLQVTKIIRMVGNFCHSMILKWTQYYENFRRIAKTLNNVAKSKFLLINCQTLVAQNFWNSFLSLQRFEKYLNIRLLWLIIYY